MEFQLYSVLCNNEDCNHEFVTNSTEHHSCPSCGENISYSDDFITATSEDSFKENINDIIGDKEDILISIIIASSYVCNDETIARFDDVSGPRLNLKESDFMDRMLKLLKLESITGFKCLVNNNLDIHPALIYEPHFSCIKRSSFTDEYGDLYEEGFVLPSKSKEFLNWINNNEQYIKETFFPEEFFPEEY